MSGPDPRFSMDHRLVLPSAPSSRMVDDRGRTIPAYIHSPSGSNTTGTLADVLDRVGKQYKVIELEEFEASLSR